MQDHSHHLIQVSNAFWTRLRGGSDEGEMELNLPALSDVEVLLQNQLLIISNHQYPCWRIDRRVEDSHKAHPVTSRFDLIQKAMSKCSWWFAGHSWFVRHPNSHCPGTLEDLENERSYGRNHMRHSHWLISQPWDASKAARRSL